MPVFGLFGFRRTCLKNKVPSTRVFLPTIFQDREVKLIVSPRGDREVGRETHGEFIDRVADYTTPLKCHRAEREWRYETSAIFS